MSLLIQNGRVITAVDDYEADIFIEDEKISVIGKNLQMNADKVIDAKEKLRRTHERIDSKRKSYYCS